MFVCRTVAWLGTPLATAVLIKITYGPPEWTKLSWLDGPRDHEGFAAKLITKITGTFYIIRFMSIEFPTST